MHTRRAKPLLGTIVSIEVECSESAQAQRAIDAAFDAISRVQTLMSFHEPTSDIARINRDGSHGTVSIHPWTYEVLQFSQELFRLSCGAFNISCGGALTREGFLPLEDRIIDAAPVGGENAVVLGSNLTAKLQQPVLIDLGGVAKGFAVDKGCEALRKNGIERGSINAGGDLRVFGYLEGFEVRTRHPEDADTLLRCAVLHEGSIATSAGHFSAKDAGKKRLVPVVTPQGECLADLPVSISVLAQECMVADALTKVIRLNGKASAALLAKLDAEAVIIQACGGELAVEHFPARRMDQYNHAERQF